MSLGRRNTEPGAPQPWRPRRRWLIAVAAIAVVAGGLVAQPWSRPGPAAPTAAVADGAVVICGEVGRWLSGL